MSRSARRREQRKKLAQHVAAGTYQPRQAHESRGTTSCPRSTTPRLMVEGYSLHEPGNRTVARYCAGGHVVDTEIGHRT